MTSSSEGVAFYKEKGADGMELRYDESASTVEGVASSRRSRKEEPRIRSMRDYIQQHYAQAICKELERRIDDGLIPPTRAERGRIIKHQHVCPDSAVIRGMSFWRFPGDELSAEVVISALVRQTYKRGGSNATETYQQLYRATLWISLDKGISCDWGDFRNDVGREKSEGQLLSEYLVPYFSSADVEQEAENIWQMLCPEALKNPALLNVGNLTERLGLNVIYLPLYRRENTKSILFFATSRVNIVGEDGRPEKRYIAAKTIVLNSNYTRPGFEREAIFHECYHFIEHRLFFKLQRAATDDFQSFRGWKPASGVTVNGNPLSWLEWQARYGGQCLQVPRPMLRERVDHELSMIEGLNVHDGAKMELIGKKMAAEFNVPNYRARNRMIQVGYWQTRGALNYVDGGYITPFTFDRAACHKSQTFTIRSGEAIAEYVRNPKFRQLLDSGRYIYVDGHFCLNDPKYVWYDGNKLRLTDWANTHVDRCCLRFITRYTKDASYRYQFGQIDSDDEYNERYLTLYPCNGTSENMPSLEGARAIAEDLMTLPRTFHETLKIHMQRCNMTLERMEEVSHLAVRTIARLRADEYAEYSLEQVFAICIALHLPPEYSDDMLQKAGITLRPIPLHMAYKVLLRCCYMESVDTVMSKIRDFEASSRRTRSDRRVLN